METGAIALGGIATVVALLGAMIRSKHPYEALWIGGVAGCLYIAAICAGIHAKWAADDLKNKNAQAMPEDRRPWLNLVEPQASRVVEGEPFYVQVACKNFGPTPATIIAKGMCGGIATSLEAVHKRVSDLIPQVVDEGHKMLVAGGATYQMRGSTMTVPVGTAEQKAHCLLFVGGLVVYTDIVGNRYETEFCYLSDWPSQSFYCDEKYNRMT